MKAHILLLPQNIFPLFKVVYQDTPYICSNLRIFKIAQYTGLYT